MIYEASLWIEVFCEPQESVGTTPSYPLTLVSLLKKKKLMSRIGFEDMEDFK